MDRVFNFSAGPSMLPVPVLEKAQKELVNYGDAGCSVMEMSHRSKPFEEIIGTARATLKEIMGIPDGYTILFLQGGASMQFSMVPMNLTKRTDTAAYSLTGQFATRSHAEAARWCNAVAVASSKESTYSYIPKITPDMLPADAKYFHFTGNNTIFGTCYNTMPDTGSIPKVCDLSSIILGREYNVSDFALIYAGAQKNMGPSGLTVVIIKDELLEFERDPVVPTMFNYKIMADNDSMYNTPPCFAIYVGGLVFEWVKQQGGVKEMEKRNREKAALLYDYLDNSAMFKNPVAHEDRSMMNVTFTLPNEDLTAAFLKQATANGMINLKGHRSVGGCRASIYNAMPLEGIKTLIACMKDFEVKNK